MRPQRTGGRLQAEGWRDHNPSKFAPFCFHLQPTVSSLEPALAASVCHDVPHRQFVFTFPKMLRGIFRKRRHLLRLLFQTATECLRDAFRARLDLPAGRIAAAATVHTEATESAALEKTAAKKMLGKAERRTILANNA